MSILVRADVATPRVEVAMWTSEPEQRHNYPQISIVSVFGDDTQLAVHKDIWM